MPRLKIFLSSTCYDLAKERIVVKRYVERLKSQGGVRFTCFASDFPDFPVSISDLRHKHSYDICLDAVRNSDLLILLLKRRYGYPLALDGTSAAITEREYLEARKFGIPVQVFVDQRTWNAREKWKRKRPQRWVSEKQEELFAFLDRLQGRPENPQPNWMTIYSDLSGVRTRLRDLLLGFDDSRFVADVTVPDNSIVGVGQRFTKSWRIRNAGVMTWRGRYIEEVNPSSPGLTPGVNRVAIPETQPGEQLTITVRFVAPNSPGSFVSYWKMHEADGTRCFREKEGLSCRVQVARDTLGFPKV